MQIGRTSLSNIFLDNSTPLKTDSFPFINCVFDKVKNDDNPLDKYKTNAENAGLKGNDYYNAINYINKYFGKCKIKNTRQDNDNKVFTFVMETPDKCEIHVKYKNGKLFNGEDIGYFYERAKYGKMSDRQFCDTLERIRNNYKDYLITTVRADNNGEGTVTFVLDKDGKGYELTYVGGKLSNRKQTSKTESANDSTATKPDKATAKTQTQNSTNENSIKSALCNLAGKKKPEDLTLDDLIQIRDKNKAELTNMKLRVAIDANAGIVNVYKQDSDKPIVHFEFNNNVNGQFRFHEEKLKYVAETMGMKLSSLKATIKNIANKTNVSERLVMNIVSTEDFIKRAKDIGDGEITVGFGHTTNAKHNNKFKKGYVISNETAFKWLEQDIKDNIKTAKKYFEDCGEWDKIPLSIRDAIVDIAFNRGEGAMKKEEVYRSLRANLQQGRDNDPASAVRVRQEYEKAPAQRTRLQAGVMKRNCYRFLMAIDDLSPEYKLAAMRRFVSESSSPKHGENYLESTLMLLKKYGYESEATILQKDWNMVKTMAENAAKV